MRHILRLATGASAMGYRDLCLELTRRQQQQQQAGAATGGAKGAATPPRKVTPPLAEGVPPKDWARPSFAVPP